MPLTFHYVILEGTCCATLRCTIWWKHLTWHCVTWFWGNMPCDIVLCYFGKNMLHDTVLHDFDGSMSRNIALGDFGWSRDVFCQNRATMPRNKIPPKYPMAIRWLVSADYQPAPLLAALAWPSRSYALFLLNLRLFAASEANNSHRFNKLTAQIETPQSR